MNGGNAAIQGGNGVLVNSANGYGTDVKDRFAYVPELNINLGYEITRCCRVYVGYDVIYFSSIAKVADQLTTATNNSTFNFGNVSNPTTVIVPGFKASGSMSTLQGSSPAPKSGSNDPQSLGWPPRLPGCSFRGPPREACSREAFSRRNSPAKKHGAGEQRGVSRLRTRVPEASGGVADRRSWPPSGWKAKPGRNPNGRGASALPGPRRDPKLHRLIVARRGQAPAVGSESEAVDRPRVARQRLQPRAAGDFPEKHFALGDGAVLRWALSPPVASRRPQSPNATAKTGPVWSVKTNFSAPLAASQIRTV